MNKRTRLRTAAIAVGVLFGLATGIGGYTFVYARGGSYLTNNPKACANCHIMQDNYDAWLKSSHRSVATCNDCHTPHNFFGKYWTKADHGFWHSYAFSTGDFHEPISMKARSRAVTENSCRHCTRTSLTTSILAPPPTAIASRASAATVMLDIPNNFVKSEPPAPDSSAASPTPPINWRRFYLFVGAATLVTLIAVALLVNIFERKQEAKNPFFRVVELTDDTEDPEVWGKNFPFQYDAYKRTADQERTRHGGSEAMPRTPTKADPRSIVSQSRLEEDPRLKTMWAGYAFARDFREERGHAFMLTDQIYTERQQAMQQPGACIHCHGSVYVPYRKAGNGDLVKGFEHYNPKPYLEIKGDFKHPIACIDCHAPDTMALRVTRPGFMEGMRALKASQGVKDYDVNRDATRQEMRSFVCGQCHVEYYFKGAEKRLTYPWAKGLKVENILAYYDEAKFKDWTHAESGAPALKAQHPEFELWNQGIHARSGVACADCHMPYTRVGATKISDHHVRSPLLNINHACQTCHKWPEAELKARVETIQDRTFRLRNLAMDALVELIGEIKAARTSGKTDEQLAPARDFQRKAQFYLDFIEAENSMGFHAPQEAARILGESIDFTRRGQKELRR